MFWQDTPGGHDEPAGEDIVDLAFRLSGGTLPLEHAHPLSLALLAALPWLAEEPRCGIHQIHVAASGNGWMRPQGDARQVLNLSRRTRLTLRLPRHRLAAAGDLRGCSLDVAGHCLQVGEARERPLLASSTLFARYVVCAEGGLEDEEIFVDRVAGLLRDMGITPTKLLCGMTSTIDLPLAPLMARSLMVAALPPDASLQLQRRGLGGGRLTGCGLFVPHRGIEAVRNGDRD
jgi:CRISPR-associated protein Cas6